VTSEGIGGGQVSGEKARPKIKVLSRDLKTVSEGLSSVVGGSGAVGHFWSLQGTGGEQHNIDWAQAVEWKFHFLQCLYPQNVTSGV